MLKQLRFMICCAGAILIYQTDPGILFYTAGMTAFANLFSAQLMCGTQACQVPQTRTSRWNPLTLFHYGTTLAGALFCLVGAFKLGT